MGVCNSVKGRNIERDTTAHKVLIGDDSDLYDYRRLSPKPKKQSKRFQSRRARDVASRGHRTPRWLDSKYAKEEKKLRKRFRKRHTNWRQSRMSRNSRISGSRGRGSLSTRGSSYRSSAHGRGYYSCSSRGRSRGSSRGQNRCSRSAGSRYSHYGTQRELEHTSSSIVKLESCGTSVQPVEPPSYAESMRSQPSTRSFLQTVDSDNSDGDAEDSRLHDNAFGKLSLELYDKKDEFLAVVHEEQLASIQQKPEAGNLDSLDDFSSLHNQEKKILVAPANPELEENQNGCYDDMAAEQSGLPEFHYVLQPPSESDLCA